MPKSIKFIGVILVFLLGVSVVVTILALNRNQSLEKGKAALEQQLNDFKIKDDKFLYGQKTLEEKLKLAEAEKLKIQKEADILNQQLKDVNQKLTDLSADRDDWKGKLDVLKKEKDDLIAKLNEKSEPQIIYKEPESAQATSPQPATISPEQMTDQFWAEVLKEKAALEVQLEKVSNDISSNADELQKLKQKNSEFQLELGRLNDEKIELERKVQYGQALADNLSLQLAREKNDKKSILARAEGLRTENSDLRAHLKELTSVKFVLEKSIGQLKNDKNTIEKKLMDTESILEGKIDEISEIKNTLEQSFRSTKESLSAPLKEPSPVELGPIVVNPSNPNPTDIQQDTSQQNELKEPAGFNGRVVSINEENNFVIIDLGENTGIQLGDPLAVYRGSQYVAGLEVIQVRKDICAADIREKMAKIQVGDNVR